MSSETRPVLIVDDSEFVKLFYEKALKGYPVKFHFAADGVEAIRLAGELKPAMILMDINLPKVSGFEAATKIRATPGLEKTVIIAVSGRRQDSFPASPVFTEFLGKPLHIDTLRNLFQRHLGI